MNTDYTWVFTFKNQDALSLNKPVPSGTKDDFSYQVHFTGNAYVMGKEYDSRTDLTRFYVKHIESPSQTAARQKQKFMIDAQKMGYRILTEEELIAKRKKVEQEYPLTASETWNRSVCLDTKEQFEANEWSGIFSGTSSGMFFHCGVGCCDDDWITEEDFLLSHRDERFRAIG